MSRRLIGTDASSSTNPAALSGTKLQQTPLRGFAAVRARPLFHLLSFGIVHQTIAWAALPPLFYFFQATGAATSLLAGPEVAWVLKQPVPRWLPLPFIDKKRARHKEAEENLEVSAERKVEEAKAGMAGAIRKWVGRTKDVSEVIGRPANEIKGSVNGEKPLLVEDVVEQLIRRAVRVGFRLSKTFYGQVKSRGRDADHVADDAIATLEGNKSRFSIPSFDFGDRARRTAEGVSVWTILDGAAAYIVVKVSQRAPLCVMVSDLLSWFQATLPVRIPLSLFLTPKFARVLSRVFR